MKKLFIFTLTIFASLQFCTTLSYSNKYNLRNEPGFFEKRLYNPKWTFRIGKTTYDMRQIYSLVCVAHATCDKSNNTALKAVGSCLEIFWYGANGFMLYQDLPGYIGDCVCLLPFYSLIGHMAKNKTTSATQNVLEALRDANNNTDKELILKYKNYCYLGHYAASSLYTGNVLPWETEEKPDQEQDQE